MQYIGLALFKKFYQRYHSSDPRRLHFAAHSHHYWPDVTRAAMLDYWDDSARYADRKWSFIWSDIVPRAQRHIARILGVSTPGQIVFAPNTHEFVNRLISCFEGPERIRILTTDGEFHSFRRQAQRLAEAGRAQLVKVATRPIDSFVERLAEAAGRAPFDLIYLSHVFFNSGLAVHPLSSLASALPEEPLLVIDGYHGFCALPEPLGDLSQRAFYISGGYKYAQSGEGVCFMHVPPDCQLRPVNTGWFAEFGKLEARSDKSVHYRDDGMRFAGATFDLSGVYRFNAVMDLLQREGIEIEHIHAHVQRLQQRFLDLLETADHPLLRREFLISSPPERPHGHFFTFLLPSEEETAALAGQLIDNDIIVDHRGNRLRFGFGMYLDETDVEQLFVRLRGL